MDTEKLIKVLGMTTSTHDGEALAALRTALKMMAVAKVSWADIIIVKKAQPMQHHNDANRYQPPPNYSDLFRQASRDPYYQANRAAYEAAQKAQARQRAEQSRAEYEEIVKAYKTYQEYQAKSKRTPGFGDDLFEAIFGKKRK